MKVLFEVLVLDIGRETCQTFCCRIGVHLEPQGGGRDLVDVRAFTAVFLSPSFRGPKEGLQKPVEGAVAGGVVDR